MKTNAVLLIVLAFGAGCKKDCEDAPANTECKVELTRGLLAYYPFNGNANDASGNNNHGTPMNGAFFTTDYLGKPNKAAGFDGVDDYILVNDGGKLNTDSISVSLMVQVNNVNRRNSIIGRWNFANAQSISWGIGQTLDATNRWDFGVHNLPCGATYTYTEGDYISHSETLQAGRWYQVLCSFANGTQRIYIDGQLKKSVNRNFQDLTTCPLSQLVIGAWWQGDLVSIDGKIDEIRIYNRLLNDCEIINLSSGFGE